MMNDKQHYCGIWRRSLAFLIDAVFIGILTAIFPLLSLLAFIFYGPVFDSSRLKGTPGKAILNLAVLKEDLTPLSFKDALIRQLLKIFTGMTFGAGYLMILFTGKKQTLHDYLTQTVVIENQPTQENYFFAWWDQIKYLFQR